MERDESPFARWLPRVAARVPWVTLGEWPTRIDRLDIPRNAATSTRAVATHVSAASSTNTAPIWIKREGDSSPRYGGNKVRTLEAWLGHTLARGARRIWAIGAYGSNHVVATIKHAHAIGLEAGAIVFPQPASEWAIENAGALIDSGVPVIRLRNVVEVPFAGFAIAAQAKLAEWRARGSAADLDAARGRAADLDAARGRAANVDAGPQYTSGSVASVTNATDVDAPLSALATAVGEPQPLFGYLVGRELARDSIVMPPGGATPIGTLGALSAAFELAEQIADGVAPAPRRIVVPAGSTCTTAGLVSGLALAHAIGAWRWPLPIVHAVRVTPWPVTSRTLITRLAAATLARIASLGGPRVDLGDPRLVVDARELGPGYGEMTPRGLAAIDAFREHARLDGVYSGKAAAALLRLHERNEGPLLFWSTKASTPLPPPSIDAMRRAHRGLVDWTRSAPPIIRSD